MFNRYTYNEPLYNDGGSLSLPLSSVSTDAGATRSPFSHSLVAVPGGRLVLFWQTGTGLVYAVSTDGGETWSASRSFDADSTVFASAVVDPATNDIHVVYSKHGTPSAVADESVYYRPLFYDTVTADWVTGGVQTLAGGGGLYDPSIAGRRNASISATSEGRLVVTYLRSEATVVTWAALAGQTDWAVADMDVDIDMGLVADEDSRGASQQSISGGTDIQWMVSRTGSTYSLSYAVLPTPLSISEAINVTTEDTWFGDTGEMVAVSYGLEEDYLGIVYLRNSKPHFRLYSLASVLPTLVSDTEMSTDTSQSVSISWDGSRFWMSWVTADSVKVSASNAPATVVQTWTNAGPDEDWSWLNTAVSLIQSPRIVFVWSQTNGGSSNKIYVGSFLSLRSIGETESGAGSDVATITPTVTETGTGVDTMAMTVPKSYTDTGTGTDALGSMNVVLTDTGAGTDVIGKNLSETEFGDGWEGSWLGWMGIHDDALIVGITIAETASGADGMSVQAVQALTDTGTGVEAISIRIPIADSGSGIEVASEGGPTEENGNGSDAMVVSVSITDTGAGADAMNPGPLLTDTGAGVDALGNVNKGGSGSDEVGAGTDSMTVAVTVAEVGAGVDAFGAGAMNILLTDSGTGVDAPSVGSIPTALFVRLLVTSGDVKLKVES